jgi:alkylation response protein AidB-like acyl-CoA dehydrogenase
MVDVTVGSDPPASAQCRALLQAIAELQPLIRSYQEEIERERRMPAALVDELRAAGAYRMFVPRELGGMEADPLTFLRAVELAAEADGSTGWNVCNNAANQLIAMSLPKEGVREIFAGGPDTMMAGTAVPGGGRAVPVEGGYHVTGRWRFGSGCREAQWMMANFQVFDQGEHGDEPRRNGDGSPAFWRFCIPAAETTVHDTWDMIGQRGTGSHDWSVTDAFVPERRTAPMIAAVVTNQWTHWSGPLYQIPAHAIIGPHHSAVATGIARRGIDELTELGGRKVPRGRTGLLRDREQVQESVGRAEAILGAAQAYRAAMVGDVWQTVLAGRETTAEQRARCRLAASYAADSARQALDLMYRAGGTTSSERTHPLARCWRDLQTVGQAVAVMPEWYPLAGRIFLGLEPHPRLM